MSDNEFFDELLTECECLVGDNDPRIDSDGCVVDADPSIIGDIDEADFI